MNNNYTLIRVKNCSAILEKAIGLVGQPKPFPLLLSTRFGVHTIGLKFEIDIIVLDSHNKVVAIKERLRPYKIYIWPIKYSKVIELPVGFIKKNKIKIGTKIKILGE